MFLSRIVRWGVFSARLASFLFLVVHSVPLVAEHTVYIPPVFVRGDFFSQWLEHGDRAGVSVRGRHEQTLDAAALGRFLGPDGKADFTIGPRYQYDLYSDIIMHRGPGAGGTDRQSVSIMPSSYLKKVDVTLWGNITPQPWKKYPHLIFFTNIALAAVEQQLNAIWQPLINKRPALNNDYQDFFEGRYNNNAPALRQTNLLYEKFNNEMQKDAGLSALTFGMAFQNEFERSALLRIQVLSSVPCGEKSDASYLFRPRRGMGRHWGIGSGIDLAVPLVDGLRASVSVSDMFWLPVYDMRTVGVKFRPFSYYLGLGKQGQQNEPVIPAANILTQDCLVQPGNAMMMKLELERLFARGHRIFASWNGLYKEAEKVSLRTTLPSATYAFAAPGYNTTATIFAPQNPGGVWNYTSFDFISPGPVPPGDFFWLQQKDLDFTVSGMPSFFESNLELGWESLQAFARGKMEGGPHVILGYRMMHGENASILPNIFTCEIGVGIKF